MRRQLGVASIWLAFGAGAEALASAAALAPAAGVESTWPHLPSFQKRPVVPRPDPSAPAAVNLASAKGQLGAKERDDPERVRVEHEGYFCTGVDGVDRKQITGSTLAGDEVTRSPQACAAGAEQDERCGQELYFGTSRDGRWHCGCVLRGRGCLKERAPEGASFAVFLVHPLLHSGPSPYSYGASADSGLEGREEVEPRAALRPGYREQVTSLHSHSVLKELIGAPAREELTKMEEFESMWDPGNARAPVPPPVEPTLPPQSQPPQGELVGMLGGGFCAGSPVIYDGPTTGWEDCRSKCADHRCSFWSFWHDSSQHRCKLTTGCRRRERDYRHNVSTFRGAQKSTDEGDGWAAADDGQEAAAPEGSQSPEVQGAPESRRTCLSPQGTARKFVASPQSGWHNLGRVDSYVNCSKTAGSKGYRNLVYNIGSVAKGRCYGFASDVPDVNVHGCEGTYCWLFGPACESVSNDEEEVQNLTGRTFHDARTGRIIRMSSKSEDISDAKVGDFVEADPKATQETKKALPRMTGDGQARAEEDATEARIEDSLDPNRATREANPAALKAEEDGTRAIEDGAEKDTERAEEDGQDDVINMDSVEGDRQATQEANRPDRKAEEEEAHTIQEVARTIVEAGEATQEASQAARKAEEDKATAEEDAEEGVMDMDSKNVEIANAEVKDSVEGESRAMQEANQTDRKTEEDKALADEDAEEDAKDVEIANAEVEDHVEAGREATRETGQAERTADGYRARAEGDAEEHVIGSKNVETAKGELEDPVEAEHPAAPEANQTDRKTEEDNERAADMGTKSAQIAKVEVENPAEAEPQATWMDSVEAEDNVKERATDSKNVQTTHVTVEEPVVAERQATQEVSHAARKAEDEKATAEEDAEKRVIDRKKVARLWRVERSWDRDVVNTAKGKVEDSVEAEHQPALEANHTDQKAEEENEDEVRSMQESWQQNAEENGALAIEDYGKRHARDAAERIQRTVLETKKQINEAEGEDARALEEVKRKVEEVAKGGAEEELEAWGKATLEALTDGQTQGDNIRRKRMRSALEGAVQMAQEAKHEARAIEDYGKTHARDAVERIKRTMLEMKRQINEADGEYEGEEAQTLEEAKQKVDEVARAGADAELEAWGKATLEALTDGQTRGESTRRKRLRSALEGAVRMSQEARQKAEEDEAREKRAKEALERIKRIVLEMKKIRRPDTKVEDPGEADREAIEDYGKKHARDAVERIKRTMLEMKRQINEADGEYEGEEAQALEEAKRQVEEVAKGGAEEELEAWGKAMLAASMNRKAQGESLGESRMRAALRAALEELSRSKARSGGAALEEQL